MSKERLEEIKKNAIVERVHFKYINNDKGYWGKTYTLIDNDMLWLIEQAERVQGLETRHYRQELIDEHIERLEQQNKRYRELLEKIKEMTRYDDCREAEIYELVSDELEDEE